MVNNKSAPAGSPAGVVNPSLAAAGSPGGSPAGTGTTGNGGVGNPGGNTGSGGTAAGSTSLGVIPGSGKPARGGLRSEATAIVNGIGNQFPGDAAIAVKGQSLDKKTLLAAFAAQLAFFADVDSSAQALKSKRRALAAATPDIRSFVAAVRAALVAFFGKGNPVLEAFGIREVKRRPLTTEQLLARKAKAAATREQRGTRGKRQKADVKFTGTVEVQTKLSGTQTAGGNPSSTGASTPTTGTNPSSAGAPTGGVAGSSQP